MNMKIKILVVIVIAVMILTVTLASCSGVLGRKGYSSTAKVSKSESVNVAQIDASSAELLLSNPNRGLRMENYITLGEKLDSYPLSGEEPFERARKNFEKYATDKTTLSQVYVYLTNYNDKDLDDLAFEQMENYFKLYKDNNIRMLLRFAYGTESVDDAPYAVMKRHIEQITQWFSTHTQLIDDTLYCMQLGMVGYWGEGHSFKNFEYGNDIKKLVKDMLAFTSENVYLQVRTKELYDKFPLMDRERVGYHDDYIIDNMDNEWAIVPRSSKGAFKSVIKKMKKTVNDGEMPWGTAKLNDAEGGAPLNRMDGKIISKWITEYSMTSFSLEHNYREKEDETFSMYEWKNQYLTKEEALECGYVVNDALYEALGGRMSIYELLRYHLGYQIAIRSYSVDKDVLTFTLRNYGMASPLTLSCLSVTVRENGVLKSVPISAYNKEKLYSGVAMTYSVRLPQNTEVVGISLKDKQDGSVYARFANATQWEDGVQYFK